MVENVLEGRYGRVQVRSRFVLMKCFYENLNHMAAVFGHVETPNLGARVDNVFSILSERFTHRGPVAVNLRWNENKHLSQVSVSLIDRNLDTII